MKITLKIIDDWLKQDGYSTSKITKLSKLLMIAITEHEPISVNGLLELNHLKTIPRATLLDNLRPLLGLGWVRKERKKKAKRQRGTPEMMYECTFDMD